MSKATDYKNQFLKEKYDSLRIVVPKGRKTDVEQYAKEQGLSVNSLVNNLLMNALRMSEDDWKARSTASDTSETAQDEV